MGNGHTHAEARGNEEDRMRKVMDLYKPSLMVQAGLWIAFVTAILSAMSLVTCDGNSGTPAPATSVVTIKAGQ